MGTALLPECSDRRVDYQSLSRAHTEGADVVCGAGGHPTGLRVFAADEAAAAEAAPKVREREPHTPSSATGSLTRFYWHIPLRTTPVRDTWGHLASSSS